MDEWTGELYQGHDVIIRRALAFTLPGLAEELRIVRACL